MSALLMSLLLFPPGASESVATLLEKAGPTNAKEIRIAALKKLAKSRPKDPERVCKTLEQYVNDEDRDVRLEVLVTLGLTASEAKLECPMSIVEAIDDPDEGVRDNAQGLVYLISKFPKEAGPLIFQATESKEPDLREFAATSLPHVVGKTQEVKKKLNQMLNDPHEFVRHHAQVGHYTATGDFRVYATYLLGYTSDINPPHPIETAQQQKDQVRRNLVRLSGGTFFYNATLERRKELAQLLIDNLAHTDAPVRQAALRQLQAMAIASRESYRAIPKAQAQAAVAKLLEDKNKKVREWAMMAQKALKDGPPPEAPEKLEDLEKFDPLK